MADIKRAQAHLEDAEATIMSWWSRMDESAGDDGTAELPFSTMLAAVLRSVSRAAGALEQDGNVRQTNVVNVLEKRPPDA